MPGMRVRAYTAPTNLVRARCESQLILLLLLWLLLRLLALAAPRLLIFDREDLHRMQGKLLPYADALREIDDIPTRSLLKVFCEANLPRQHIGHVNLSTTGLEPR